MRKTGQRVGDICAPSGPRLLLVLCALLVTETLSGAGTAEYAQGPVANGYTVKSWQTGDGLPQGTPTAITQTSDGYLWIGTFNGLARFDGVRFTSFTVNNTPELISDSIRTLYEDRAGALWVGTDEGGLLQYRNGRFSAVPGPEISSRMTIHSICEHGGMLWVGASEGLYQIVDGQLREIADASLTNRAVIGVVERHGGGLWISTRTEIWSFEHGSLEGPFTSRVSIHGVATDPTGQLWISFERGRMGMLLPEKGIIQVPQTLFKATALHLASDGNLLLGTLDGRVLAIEPTHTPTRFSTIAPLEGEVSSLYQDLQGNLWVGLEAGGLRRLKKKLVAQLGAHEGLTIPSATSILLDHQGRIWAGTFGKGLHRWDGERFERLDIPKTPNITSLLEDKKGEIWFATYGGQLGRLTPEGGFEFETRFGHYARTLFQDREGGIWMGLIEDGLQHWSGGRLVHYTIQEGLSSNHIRPIAQDHEGSIWVGTSRGLNRIRQGRIERYFREHGLAGNHVRSLLVDRTGTLWIGSTGGGLTRWRNNQFQSIGVEQGLIHDWIEQIIEDDQGYLWLGSNQGLIRVQLEELNQCLSGTRSSVHCLAIRQEEGLNLPGSGTGFQPSCLKTADGKLWFATESGIAVIDPASLPLESSPPPVFVEEVRADEEVLRVEGNSRGPMVLPPGTDRLEFRYTGLDFSAPGLVQFRYQLVGFDRHWISAGTGRAAVYTRLPPGEYRFRVLAANNHGVWNESGAVLAFAIRPFFWQTALFQFAAAGALLALTIAAVWSAISWRHRQVFQTLQQRHALERERTRIAEDMHDGLGASLVKIAMLGELAENRLSEPDQGRPQIHRMSTTARQVVRDMDEIVWAVNPKNDTLENFAGYLCQFASEHFTDTGIECHLDIPPELPARRVRAEVRHNLFLAVREALNNVVKHSQASQVCLRIQHTPTDLQIEVQDNGRGGSIAPRKHRNGLGNMEHRLTQIGGQIEIDSTNEGDTSVRFRIRLEP